MIKISDDLFEGQDDLFEENENKFIYNTAFELTRKNGSFSLEDMIRAFEKQSFWDYDEYELEEDWLTNADFVVLPDKKAIRYFCREAYFENAEFLIKPTPFEVENAVLFIGHRLLPFVPEEDACVYKLFDVQGNQLEPKQMKTPLRELQICYSLYSAGGGFFTAIDDCDFDELFVPTPDTTVTAGGLELKPFISKTGFTTGDYIKVRLKDYGKGECEIEYVPLSKISSNFAAITKWQEKFEAGLKKAINRRKEICMAFENEDLIAEAFYYAGKELFRDPAYSWLDTIRISKKFALQAFDDRLFVWEKEGLEDYMQKVIKQDDKAYREYLDELKEERDEYLEFDDPEDMDYGDMAKIMGFHLTENILTAYMLDALHFNGSIEDVKKRCFDARIKEDYPELEERFDEILVELWEDAKELPPEARTIETVKLRHDLLQLKDKETAFLRSLDKLDYFDVDNLKSEEFVRFREISMGLDEFIVQLELQPFTSNKEFKKIEKMTAFMVNGFNLAIKNLEDTFLSQADNAAKTAYVFKVKLSHDKRTYREIAIRKDQTFAKLHEAIFNAFDRCDEHLYSFYFTQGGKSRNRFRDAPEITDPRNMEDAGYKEMHNAEKTPVGKFPMPPGFKFEYLFDFGDEWLHEIEVVSVISVSPDDKLPRVVKKKGASPEQYD